MSMNSDRNNENELITQRRQRLQELRKTGDAFGNDFRRDALAADLIAAFGERDRESFENEKIRVSVAGRMMTRRNMGKASFAHIQDMSGQIQLYIRRDNLPDGIYNTQFKQWDIGDIIGASGVLMKTGTGELSICVDAIRLLSKSLRPLPEKFHGLTNQEMRYRQRYVDLIMNQEARRIFKRRSETIDFIRHYLVDRKFMEVETPMMHPIPGGALARPFETHHNSLDMQLFLRIAPELYLKRLIVGGFERVFEINRSFRNEGLSTQHNPEFTMLEFYQAYADYRDAMDMTENLLSEMALAVCGSHQITYQGYNCNLAGPFERMTLAEAILKTSESIGAENLRSTDALRDYARQMDIPLEAHYGIGKIQLEIFEKTVEAKLTAPTFITEYPTEVSPLARRNTDNPEVTDRFELFIGGREIANGFSELNDPEEQAARFRGQLEARQAGETETMHYDEDYIKALEYGMPPTAGVGIGIDRLVMLLTDTASIRDVILFPHMRPPSSS